MGSVNTILQSDNIHRVARADYRRKRDERIAGNKLQAQGASLANFTRSLANQARMEAAGKEFNAATTKLAHELEQAGKDKVNVQLQHAEAQGALMAQAAMVGVGGSTVELMDQLTNLQRSIFDEEQERARVILERTGREATASIVKNAASSSDLQQTFGTFDYTKDLAPKELQHKWLTVLGVAVATYFGGPQAGEAAADAAVGEWKARNGDFVGAGQSFGGALSGIAGAVRDYNERGGGAWANQFKRGDKDYMKEAAFSNNSSKTGTSVKSVNSNKTFFKWGG